MPSTTAQQTYTAVRMSKLMNLSERHIRNLAKDGVITRQPGGRYYLSAATEYIVYLQDRTAGQNLEPAEKTSEQNRLVSARADGVEMDNETKRGRLVSADAMVDLWARITTNVRTRFLGIPSKMGPAVRAAISDVEAAGLLESEIRECLEELSSASGVVSRSGPDSVEDSGKSVPKRSKAAAKTKRQPVGRPRKKAQPRK